MNVSTSAVKGGAAGWGRAVLSKVPEITVYFWIIKVLCTTVGETFADFLGTTLNLGEAYTGLIMAAILAVVLYFQFKAKKYVPGVYWLSIVLISVVGTLITDNLSDNLGVPLVTSSIIFGIALVATFAAWYAKEKTLSIHSITTRTREVFYWLAILFTFALGTAVGDLIAEQFDLGYLVSLGIFAGAIAVVTIAYYAIKKLLPKAHRLQSTVAVIAFWIAYILTRPLGASIGDYLSQAQTDGGLGLGTTVTSFIFLGAILCLVLYLAWSKRDVVALPVVD